MFDARRETPMIHFHCWQCGVNATCVANDAAMEAWHQHMMGHDDPAHYRAVTWTAVELDL
jgi:hypothetical protein